MLYKLEFVNILQERNVKMCGERAWRLGGEDDECKEAVKMNMNCKMHCV